MEELYSKSIEEIFTTLKTSKHGLSNKVASQNLKKYGYNELVEKEKKSKARVFLEQFQDLLVILLIISALISTFIGEIESMIVIFFVIVLNAILGTYQHFKAEKSITSLKTLSSPYVTVIRENKEFNIPAREVVVGDIVIIKAGDMISADGRIFEDYDLEVNESSLTGESQGITKTSKTLTEKKLILANQSNMVFSGTSCIKGRGKYVVTKTGMNTEIGRIAKMISEAKVKKTPLQNSLDSFSRILAIGIILVCIVVFILSIYRHISILDSLMFAVSLAVAAIPEALSTIVVIVLAIGTERMASNNAIIKELKAVEGLGCVTVICTDKTGTLTQNKMAVRDAKYYGNKDFFLECLILSSNNTTPTENAILDFALLNNREKIVGEKLKELSFTSNRKMMSILYRKNNQTTMYSKGASEALLPRIKYIKTSSGFRLIENEDLDKINHDINIMTNQGLRVITFAYKEMGLQSDIKFIDETNLIFVGLVSLVDPLRPESRMAVYDCFKAGIKPVMLTGDHKNTAMYIAKETGIFREKDMIVSGEELDQMSDDKLYQDIDKISVYSRLTPAHKIRIVETWQKKGAIVAMTGDGINDAPALKQADIGIAMGKSGTEVAKEASAMILTDDNFSTIIKAVANGRNVYQNIQNAIRFLLSGNFAGILIVLFVFLFDLPLPFVAVHLLFINLLTDSLPAIAIGMEDGNDKDLLKRPPRKANENFINKKLLLKIAIEGLIITIFVILSYLTGLKTSNDVARTMTFATLCLARLFHSFNCVRARSFLVTGFKNTYLVLTFLICMILINAVLFIPELQKIFVVSKLTHDQLITVYGYSLMPTIILQMHAVLKYQN
ncbi:MAG TPA: cation-translocating P-type ATPase [Acholeplasmataceae bacterium]|nr:cation-translocating P-type ATPase [Acholeplasmataceae bacterium]